MINILEQLNIEFKLEKKFKWSNNKRYDFYIPSLNCIIETHGEQHYKESFSKIKSSKKVRTLEEEQENDRIKKELALKNGIEHYIVIDCRKSELEYIKNNILSSKLAKLFDLSNIDWIKVGEFAYGSLVKKACELWNKGIKNTKEIGRKMNLSSYTIVHYLNKGRMLNWCNYDAKKAKYKKIICLTTDEIFNSIKEAQNKYGIGHISSCCQGKQKSAGKHPVTGESLRWMYYEGYLNI